MGKVIIVDKYYALVSTQKYPHIVFFNSFNLKIREQSLYSYLNYVIIEAENC